MTTLRALIVDDEPLALSLLKAKLNKVSNVEVIGECKNGREAITATSDLSPDILFLDIQMPGLNGFDVVKRLQTDTAPMIVFTTAFEQYALDAFDVHAVDYILKPIDDERIQRAVDRAIARIESAPDEESQKSRVVQAIDAINERELKEKNIVPQDEQHYAVDQKIVIREREEIILLDQEKVEWVDAAGDYCCLHAEGKTYIKRIKLKDLLKELDSNIFKRVHRSTIVNLNFILKVIPHTKGEFFLQINEFERIKVSRNYKDVIRTYLANMD